MLLLVDKAEIFLNYLLNTRQAITGGYYCVCRRSDGKQIELKGTHKTQDAALQQGQRAAIIDTLAANTAPQMLVVLSDEGDKIVTANRAAEKLLGGKLDGLSYNWPSQCSRCELLKMGQCHSKVRCVELNGRQCCSEVVEQLIKIGHRKLALVTINP